MNEDLVQIQHIHPWKLTVPDWVTACKGIWVEGLMVGQGLQSPHHIDAVFASHVLGIVTSEHNLQEVTRINDREYGGRFSTRLWTFQKEETSS